MDYLRAIYVMRILNVLILGVFLGACSEREPSSVDMSAHAKNILHLCPSFAETGKPALVYGAECGELRVKENPADANSREISLNILRLPAINPAPKNDPLFLIQGGPGGSSVDMAASVHTAFSDVRKNRDLIFVDQRGTGKSNPLNCEDLTAVDQLLLDDQVIEKQRVLTKACAEKYRDIVQFYTTPYAVKDVDLVRKALGYETINLWGGSYGTRVVLEYLREFPQQARTAILDGVAPVQIALPKYFQADAMAALQSVSDECGAQEKCAENFGDLVKKANTITARLLQAQADAKPITIDFEHPRHQQKTTLVLTARRFSSLVFMSLYSRDLTVLLPYAIANAERGNYRLIASLSALVSEQSDFMSISEGMRYSVVCNEDAHFISPEDVASAKSFFGMNMLKDMVDTCALWPKAKLTDNYYDPVMSEVPSLLLSGYHDPVTPARWADSVAPYLKNAIKIIAPGGNHSISMEGCLPKLIAQFIEQGSAKAINAECANKIIPLPLVLGASELKASLSSQQSASSKGIDTL
jgi:pimeloyl-ACP methyl ester carboxylesterase